MTVIVSKGLGICNGCIKLQETDRTLALQASDSQDRIDTVVLRLNDNDNVRTCDFYIINGLPSNSPVRPELTRNESVWEIGLADLFISANSTTISSTRITDTRLDSERCGVMSSISEFDTTGLYEQIQSDMAEFKNVEQQEFLEWFETIVGILDEEVAGHLQLEIGMLANLTTSDKTDLVHAINEVNAKVGDTDELPDPTKNVVENVTALNTNLVALEQDLKTVDELLPMTSIGTTSTAYNLNVGKKISDYKTLIFEALFHFSNVSEKYYTQFVINRDVFSEYVDYHHMLFRAYTNDNTYALLFAKYNNDTSINIYKQGKTYGFDTVAVYGVK